MHPILLQSGGLYLRSYTLLLDLGLLIGLAIFYRRARRRIARPHRWLDAALVALLLGVVGARFGYVAAHWAYFTQQRDEIARFWLGGLSWHGGLIGAWIGLVLYCWLKKLSFLRLADELALVAPLVGAAAWLGCLLAGCAYGRELEPTHWLAADLPDLFGVWALRANVQLVAAGWSLFVAGVLWALRNRLATGMVFGLFLLLYGAGLGLSDSFRGDAVPHLWGWRADLVLDWLLAAVGGCVAGAALFRKRVQR